MRHLLFVLLFLSSFNSIFSISNYASTNWNNAGISTVIPTSKTISIVNFGGKADYNTDNAPALQAAIKSTNGIPTTILIPAGNYIFKKSISIPSGVVLKGEGSDKTILNFNLNGSGDLFSIQGNADKKSTTAILSGTTKGNTKIQVDNSSAFSVGDYIQIQQNANVLLASDWAYNYFFQIAKITKINNQEISFENPLRMDFPISNKPTIQKINPIQNVGIESLKIKRNDATGNQTSNLFFNYAINCWVKGIESEQTNYAHITLQSSAFNTISGNYLHDAFDYGSGGKGYGVVLQFGASDNIIEDNIAQHLRHSFLLQAAANGNVIAYNYSYNPYWKEGWFPANAAGDIVLHGNYPYSNLFEGNIVQNLVIDNSHGINGAGNIFFRNRIENYGVVMNGNSGDNMYFIANEITGSGLLKGLFTLTGNQTEIANYIKGNTQAGSVNESSLISKNYGAKIGLPNKPNSGQNEAFTRNNKALKTNYKVNNKAVILPKVTNDIKQKSDVTENTVKGIKPTKNKKCCVLKKKKNSK